MGGAKESLTSSSIFDSTIFIPGITFVIYVVNGV